MLVEHHLGQVQSATPELQYTLSGQVKTLQGGTLLVDKSLVQPHPARALLPGAVLEVRLDDRRVVEARLVREADRAVVRSISTPEGTSGTLQLRGERGDDEVTVRLPADDLRQIRVGDVLEMGISYAPDGKRKISLAQPDQKAAAPAPSKTPPISAALLNDAYQAVLRGSLLQEWQFHPGALSYEILEILPNASLKMVQKIYRLIALQIHPDADPGQAARATEMMKLLNAAYDQVLKKKGERRR